MLLYKELRDTFSGLPATGMSDPRARAERRRILAVAAGERSAGDWLTLAETSLLLSGRADARMALSHLKQPLSPGNAARARLVEAMLAGQELRYAEAARLFAEALPALPRDRRAVAAYGAWFARSLAEPDRAFPPPNAAAYADDPVAVLARAEAGIGARKIVQQRVPRLMHGGKMGQILRRKTQPRLGRRSGIGGPDCPCGGHMRVIHFDR